MAGRPQTRGERLDQRSIVAAALRISSENGIDALTMRALAGELKVSLGAVYNHVDSRVELLDMVADEVLGLAPSLSDDVDDPWTAIIEHTIGIQDLLDRYAGLDVVVMQRSSTSKVSKRARADMLRVLQAYGLSRADAHHVRRSVTWLWLGARTSLGGRPQTPTERAQFARALDDMIAGFRHSLNDSQGEP